MLENKITRMSSEAQGKNSGWQNTKASNTVFYYEIDSTLHSSLPSVHLCSVELFNSSGSQRASVCVWMFVPIELCVHAAPIALHPPHFTFMSTLSDPYNVCYSDKMNMHGIKITVIAA